MPVISDICNPGLILAMDYKEQSSMTAAENEDNQDRWKESVLNILEANDFDAIPLVSEPQGYPVRVARRRYHDGDHSELFVLNLEEVQVFLPNSSIIDVVFSVLSNEHHIALVGSNGSMESIVTLDTLASPNSNSPLLRRYLDLKVADVASSVGSDLPADLGRRAFGVIRELANLIDSDRGSVSDGEFTQMSIDALSLLQPLKEHSKTDVDEEVAQHWRPPSSLRERGDGLVVASDFMRPFMAGVREGGSSSVTGDARDSLSLANDFSNILLLSSERKPIGLFRQSGGSWLLDEVGLNFPGQTIESLLGQLSNMDRRGDHPLVVLRMEGGGFGIITQEEASSDVPVFWLLKKLAVLENRCREWLVSQGVDQVHYSYRNNKDTVSIEKASFGQILHHDSRFSDALAGGGELARLVRFRNDIVHSVVAERGALELSDLSGALRSMKALESLISS